LADRAWVIQVDELEIFMEKVNSKDGTPIAFDRSGEGPPIILVDGALCYRASGPMGPLAKLLAQHFTVYTYDRRGRGDSGNTSPYAVEREVDTGSFVTKGAGYLHAKCALEHEGDSQEAFFAKLKSMKGREEDKEE